MEQQQHARQQQTTEYINKNNNSRFIDIDEQETSAVNIQQIKKEIKPCFDLKHPTIAEKEEELQKKTETQKLEAERIRASRFNLYTIAIYAMGFLGLLFWRYKSYFFTSTPSIL